MILEKENIKRTFSTFHDGTICGFENHSNGLKLKIDCYYLSERIDPKYECFFVDLLGLTKLEFKPWSDKKYERKTISDLKTIGQWSYNIFTCKIENGLLHIDVEIEGPKTSLVGGTLILNCDGIKIFDQSLKELSFAKLIELSKDYWTEFKNRAE